MRQDWRRLPWLLRYWIGGKVASELRRVTILATHRHCIVDLPRSVYVGPGFSLLIPGPGTFVAGPGTTFRRDFVCEISGEGRVTMGAGTVFTSAGLVLCTTSIEIGEGCGFGQSTLIADGFHRFRDPTKHLNDQGYDYRPIRIEDNVSVAAKCTIGADLGRQCTIGANSVVIKPIPAYCFAAGAPARVIEYYGPPELRPPELATAP
jgi:acetyltransferase-like isoleucine patch superfamily enzyme